MNTCTSEYLQILRIITHVILLYSFAKNSIPNDARKIKYVLSYGTLVRVLYFGSDLSARANPLAGLPYYIEPFHSSYRFI